MTLYRGKFGGIRKPPERGGGRPAVAVRLRRTSRPSAVSSSFVNRPTRTDETARRAPHHPRPRAGPSVPAPSHACVPTYTWCMVCVVCVPCYVLVCCALCAQVRRRMRRAEARRGRWPLTGPTCLFCFLPAFQVGFQNGPVRAPLRQFHTSTAENRQKKDQRKIDLTSLLLTKPCLQRTPRIKPRRAAWGRIWTKNRTRASASQLPCSTH